MCCQDLCHLILSWSLDFLEMSSHSTQKKGGIYTRWKGGRPCHSLIYPTCEKGISEKIPKKDLEVRMKWSILRSSMLIYSGWNFSSGPSIIPHTLFLSVSSFWTMSLRLVYVKGYKCSSRN